MKEIKNLVLEELLAGLLLQKEMVQHEHKGYVYGSDDCIAYIRGRIGGYDNENGVENLNHY